MYQENWDKFYRRTYRLLGKKALWDVAPEASVALDFELFKEYLKPDLPIMDIGCGIGSQSQFLANFYTSVFGVDVANEAIKIAKKNSTTSNIQFDFLDLTQPLSDFANFEKRIPSNIYMRGVLHQIKEEHLLIFRQNLLQIMGKTGRMYIVEVADSIRSYADKSSEGFSKLPTQLRQTFISHLPPKGLSLENLNAYFPNSQFSILKSGETGLQTNIQFTDKQPVIIPAVYAILEKSK
jgi:cyclopropane fatty-acyl-phospholipid synthase-like methyltransferase